jgi:hypothetical protein
MYNSKLIIHNYLLLVVFIIAVNILINSSDLLIYFV